MTHKAIVNGTIRWAARNVWLQQMDGTDLPYIVVKVDSRASGIKLIAVTTGKPELTGPEEIAIFKGGKPKWRALAMQERAKYPTSYAGLSLAETYERCVKSIIEEDYAHITREIENALHHKGPAWLRERGLDAEYGPGAILTDYLRKGEVLPAAMLAHVILYEWSRHPVVHYLAFFDLCNRLLAYHHRKKAANTGSYQGQYAQIISLCVANYSNNLNRLTAQQVATKRPIQKTYLVIHRMLLDLQSSSSWRDVTFAHIPDPHVTAIFL